MPKVLIVEDDIGLAEILEVRLQAEGYQTLAAHNGQEGLQLAIAERPDLIIADIMMPLLSGFDMLKDLKNRPETKNSKVIIYTALGSPQDRTFGESLGVAKYLVKSQDTITEDLLKAVSEVVSPQAANPQPAAPTQPAAPAPNPPQTPPAQTLGAPVPPAEPANPPQQGGNGNA